MGFNYMTFCILDRIISCMDYVGLRNDSTVKMKDWVKRRGSGKRMKSVRRKHPKHIKNEVETY